MWIIKKCIFSGFTDAERPLLTAAGWMFLYCRRSFGPTCIRRFICVEYVTTSWHGLVCVLNLAFVSFSLIHSVAMALLSIRLPVLVANSGTIATSLSLSYTHTNTHTHTEKYTHRLHGPIHGGTTRQ